MNDSNGQPDRGRARAAADLHRHRVMDPADAMVNHILDLACEGDMAKARTSLREAARRDPAFAERYERTARVLELLKGVDHGRGAVRCPDLASRIIDRVEHHRLFTPPRRTLGRGRSAIAGAGLALMAVLALMQFRTPAGDATGSQAAVDGSPLAAQTASIPSGPLQRLLEESDSFARSAEEFWSLPLHAATYEGRSRREGLLPFNSPTARRPDAPLEAFTLACSWRLAPTRLDGLPAGLIGLARPSDALEANLRRAMDR